MQRCIKCHSEMPDGAPFCPWCGKNQLPAKRTKHRRGNGQGTAYKRGNKWTAMVILGYKVVKGKDGKEKKVAVKRTQGGFATKTDALKACEGLRKTKRAAIAPTFEAVYSAWEKEYMTLGKTKSTLNCYRSAKKYFADISFYPFDQIDLEDLQTCVNECPHGKRTRENMKALASLMYKYAIPRHWSDLNYAEYIVPGGEEGGTYPAFSKTHVEMIAKSIGIVPHAEDVYCLIYTGFRPTEFFALRKEDYHDEDGVKYLTGGIKTKAGKGRAVTISPKIQQIVEKRLKGESEFLFPKDDGGQMHINYFRDNYFYQVLDAVGIQKLPTKETPAYYVPYSCRHTFSNMLKVANGADKDKASLIGHEDYTTTKKIYQSAELENMKRITDQF